jgi:hypothetical protein
MGTVSDAEKVGENSREMKYEDFTYRDIVDAFLAVTGQGGEMSDDEIYAVTHFIDLKVSEFENINEQWGVWPRTGYPSTTIHALLFCKEALKDLVVTRRRKNAEPRMKREYGESYRTPNPDYRVINYGSVMYIINDPTCKFLTKSELNLSNAEASELGGFATMRRWGLEILIEDEYPAHRFEWKYVDNPMTDEDVTEYLKALGKIDQIKAGLEKLKEERDTPEKIDREQVLLDEWEAEEDTLCTICAKYLQPDKTSVFHEDKRGFENIDRWRVRYYD